MYIYLSEKNAILELIQDEDPVFPGVPVEKRYAPEFVQKLLHVPDETEVQENWLYDPEAETFAPPPEPPEEPLPEPDPPGSTLPQRVEALEQETAALTAAIERGLNL